MMWNTVISDLSTGENINKMKSSILPLPAWISALPEADRAQQKLRYLIRAAALYHTENGSVAALSYACGWGKNTLHMIHQRGQMTTDAALKIEAVVGRDVLPRELLLPEIFAVPEE